jgi:hypothetical protein
MIIIPITVCVFVGFLIFNKNLYTQKMLSLPDTNHNIISPTDNHISLTDNDILPTDSDKKYIYDKVYDNQPSITIY